MLWDLVGSLLLAFVLSFVSRRLHLRWPGRWLILAVLTWFYASVGMTIEAYLFMTTAAVSSLENSLFTVLIFLLPSLFLAALVAALFRSQPPFEPRLRFIKAIAGADEPLPSTHGCGVFTLLTNLEITFV